MNTGEWQWRDTSAVGHLQRIASDGAYNAMQRAYRAFLNHSTTCGDCLTQGGRCHAAEQLWITYRSARQLPQDPLPPART